MADRGGQTRDFKQVQDALWEEFGQLRRQVSANTQAILRTSSATAQSPGGSNAASVSFDVLMNEIERIKNESERNALHAREMHPSRQNSAIEAQQLLEAELIALKNQVAENEARSKRNSELLMGVQPTTTMDFTSAATLYPPSKASEAFGKLRVDQQALVRYSPRFVGAPRAVVAPGPS